MPGNKFRNRPLAVNDGRLDYFGIETDRRSDETLHWHHWNRGRGRQLGRKRTRRRCWQIDRGNRGTWAIRGSHRGNRRWRHDRGRLRGRRYDHLRRRNGLGLLVRLVLTVLAVGEQSSGHEE